MDTIKAESEQSDEVIIEESFLSENPISELLYSYFKKRVVYSDEYFFCFYENEWHIFNYDHREIYQEPTFCRIPGILQSIILPKIESYCNTLKEEYKKDPKEGGLLHLKMTKACELLQKINNRNIWSMVNRITSKDCVKIFNQDDFYKTFDKNEWLIGDQNGVYDLEHGKHRLAVPDDRVSMKMGASYVNYSWEHKDVTEAMNLLKKTFVDPKKWIDSIASCLRRKNSNNIFVWSGGENSGKTTAMKIVQEVFGDYYFKVNQNNFINPYDYHFYVHPRLRRKLKTICIVEYVICEVNKFNLELIKTFPHECTPIIISNDISNLISVKVIPFGKKFPPNLKIFNQTKDLKNAFYWIFLQHFKQLCKLNF